MILGPISGVLDARGPGLEMISKAVASCRVEGSLKSHVTLQLIPHRNSTRIEASALQ
jgi:hypothetical protein